jgi:outer membrane protein
VEAARERVRLAEQEVAQARDRFRSGVAGNGDVITASLTLNGARTDLIDALTAYHRARVSLAHAEGRAASLR